MQRTNLNQLTATQPKGPGAPPPGPRPAFSIFSNGHVSAVPCGRLWKLAVSRASSSSVGFAVRASGGAQSGPCGRQSAFLSVLLGGGHAQGEAAPSESEVAK